jgi:hypothetical protein
MDVDADDFRQHYGALSDQALLRLNPDDLTDVARQCYQVELFHRGLKRAVPPKLAEPEQDEPQLVSLGPRYSVENLPWESSAFPASEFEYAEDAERARDVLERAGIPCALVGKKEDASLGYRRKYRGRWIALLVPRSYLDAAQSRLRAEIDEPAAEKDYANHFVEFSDDELLDVDIQALPANGRKWYRAELEQRGLDPRGLSTIPFPPSVAGERADGLISVATLPQSEAGSASRLLERAAIPCRVERDAPQGGFECFAVLVPAAHFDQASDILDQHQTEIFKHEPTEGQALDDPS